MADMAQMNYWQNIIDNPDQYKNKRYTPEETAQQAMQEAQDQIILEKYDSAGTFGEITEKYVGKRVLKLIGGVVVNEASKFDFLTPYLKEHEEFWNDPENFFKNSGGQEAAKHMFQANFWMEKEAAKNPVGKRLVITS